MKRTTASGGLMAIWFGLAVLLPCTAAGSFQNNTVSNLVLWLAADMGVTTNASGVVTTWTDQSSSGRNATLLAGDPKLHLTSFANAKPAIWFDGNTDALSFSSVTDIRTTVWVVNEDAGASASAYKVVLGHSSKYDFHRGDGTPRGLFGTYTLAAVKNGSVYYNGTSVLYSAKVPTDPVIIAVATTGNAEASQIGRDRVDNANTWHGYIAEVMCFTHVLSTNELNTVGWYLSSKYGISSAYEPDPLGVSADPATGVGLNVATLNGSVTGDGGEGNPYVYFCWDTSDKETASTGAWTHVVSMGNGYGVGASFNHPLSNLSEDQAYVFRVYATNTAGDTAWSGLRSFSTFGPPEVIQLGTTGLGMDKATLRGEVMSTGGQTTTAGFEYWQTGEAVTSSVSAGTQSGPYQTEVTELATDTPYTFRAWASNDLGGKVFSDTATFRTLDRET